MKKFFTLVAATLMAVGANAQKTYDFSEAFSTTDETNFAADADWEKYDKDDAGTDVRWCKVTENSDEVLKANDAEVEWTKGLKFTFTARSASKTSPTDAKLRLTATSKQIQLNGAGITVTIPSLKAGYTIEVSYKPAGDGDRYLSASNLNVTQGFATNNSSKDAVVGIGTVEADGDVVLTTTGGGINISYIIVKDGETILTKDEIVVDEEQGGNEEQGDGDTTEGTIIASYEAGTMTGTWSTVGTSANDDNLAFSAKYNKNSTSVTTITLPSGATKDGAWQYAVKVEGEFKTGDVITIQPFTQMSTTDFTSGTKYANILLYYEKVDATTSETSPKQIADLTGSAAGALTVTDGHEEEGTPKEFTYTLEDDYTNLFFARGGNTRINLMKVTITRPTSTGINAVTTETVKLTATKKYVEGNQIVIIKDGKKYNVAGAQVK